MCEHQDHPFKRELATSLSFNSKRTGQKEPKTLINRAL